MKKAVIVLSVLFGMPLLGCATHDSNRKVSSDGGATIEKSPQVCGEYEKKKEDGSCERVFKGDRPLRRGGN